ncbi:hypothetical protein ACFX2J_042234 [Malus domestica]
MCTVKWRNLLKEFKKARHQVKVGARSAKMSYYEDLQDLLRDRSTANSNHNSVSAAAAVATPPKLDSFVRFSNKGLEDSTIPFGPMEANDRSTLNLERQLDHDGGDPLAITAADAVAVNGVPPWNWREGPENGGEDHSSYCGRIITVKLGEYTRRIGIWRKWRGRRPPEKKNIRRAITNLIRSADSGDVLFVHYCGHGTHLPAETGDDDDTGYDECIVPTAMNLITDDDFRGFVDQLPAGCRLTIASDSCHSSGLIDEAIEQIGERAPRGKSASASPAPAVAVLVDSRTFSRTGREMPESPPAQKQPEPWKEEKKPEHQPEPTEVREEKTIPLSSPFLSAQRRDSDPSCSSPSIHQHSSSSGEA